MENRDLIAAAPENEDKETLLEEVPEKIINWKKILKWGGYVLIGLGLITGAGALAYYKGYKDGDLNGFLDGLVIGADIGHDEGFSKGYECGYDDCENEDYL